ncbi:ABC transporter permease [Candidatus Margulisiibacteriota bacterium]
MFKLLSNLSYRAYYVWLRNLISYRRYVVVTFVASLGEPLLYLVAMGIGLGSYMGLINGMPYLNFIAPGLLISAAMFSAVYECTFSSMVRMKMEKVFNEQIVTPVSVEDVIAGEILWGMTRAVMSGMIMFFALLLFGLISFKVLIPMFLLWLSVGYLFSAMSMVVTAFAPSFDFFTYYLGLFITPMFFFSGIFFPLDKFPEVVQTIALFLPLYHAVAISRAFIHGPVSTNILFNFLALLIPGSIFFVWALYQMKKRLIK